MTRHEAAGYDDAMLRNNGPVRFAKHQKLPPGYAVVQLDSGHYLWTEGDRESSIHWNRWPVFRGAWADYRSRSAERSETANAPTVSVAEHQEGSPDVR